MYKENFKEFYYATEISQILHSSKCTYDEAEEILNILIHTIKVDRELAELGNKSINNEIFPRSEHDLENHWW